MLNFIVQVIVFSALITAIPYVFINKRIPKYLKVVILVIIFLVAGSILYYWLQLLAVDVRSHMGHAATTK